MTPEDWAVSDQFIEDIERDLPPGYLERRSQEFMPRRRKSADEILGDYHWHRAWKERRVPMSEIEVARVIAWLKQRVGQAEAMWPMIGKLGEHIATQASELAALKRENLALAARLRETGKTP